VRPVFGFLISILISGITACGEREQILEPQSEKRYQGAHDANPWDNAPPVAELLGGTWSKGDRQSWEDQIKRRQGAQNERNPR
jgi:hypothetical protein